jgi:hypothetical protein
MKESARKSIQWGFHLIRAFYCSLLNIGYQLNLLSVRRIPVIINNFNRLSYLRDLIEALESRGFTNIIILDNLSTYPPLLEFYKTCPHKIIRLVANYGHLALWKSGIYNQYKWNYFVYTDPDLVPVEQCPPDFLAYFKTLLDKNYRLDKIGFGIKIDDLPDRFSLKERVVGYESKYWEKEVAPGVYDAPVDTTFALYKPFSTLKAGEIYTLRSWRTGFPYLIKHLPWYVDSLQLSPEDRYYLDTCNASSTLGKELGGKEKIY